MKVTAINSSPNMGNGTTAMILNPFLDGLKEEGAEVELFYTRELDIKPCMGNFHCWIKKPGVCIQDDDMKMLLPKIFEADILVLATPVYVDGMSGPMKNMIDRILPSAEPFVVIRDGHCRHPHRDEGDGNNGKTNRRLVLVSTCGFYEMDNFDPLITHIKAICRNSRHLFAGALLRPHAPAMPHMVKMHLPVGHIFNAAKKAGRELALDGEISNKTLDAVSKPLIPLKMYVNNANKSFKKAIAKNEA